MKNSSRGCRIFQNLVDLDKFFKIWRTFQCLQVSSSLFLRISFVQHRAALLSQKRDSAWSPSLRIIRSFSQQKVVSSMKWMKRRSQSSDSLNTFKKVLKSCTRRNSLRSRKAFYVSRFLLHSVCRLPGERQRFQRVLENLGERFSILRKNFLPIVACFRFLRLSSTGRIRYFEPGRPSSPNLCTEFLFSKHPLDATPTILQLRNAFSPRTDLIPNSIKILRVPKRPKKRQLKSPVNRITWKSDKCCAYVFPLVSAGLSFVEK